MFNNQDDSQAVLSTRATQEMIRAAALICFSKINKK
jgi:hypothetical protein